MAMLSAAKNFLILGGSFVVNADTSTGTFSTSLQNPTDAYAYTFDLEGCLRWGVEWSCFLGEIVIMAVFFASSRGQEEEEVIIILFSMDPIESKYPLGKQGLAGRGIRRLCLYVLVSPKLRMHMIPTKQGGNR